MFWAIVIALVLVVFGLPLLVALLFSRTFWLGLGLATSAAVVLYSCKHDAPRARRAPPAASAR